MCDPFIFYMQVLVRQILAHTPVANALLPPGQPGNGAVDGAHVYASRQSAMNGRHNAATSAILRVCSLSDLITSVEPKRRYACHRGTTCPVSPDGSVLGMDGAHDTFDTTFARTLPDAKHRAAVKHYGFGTPERRLDWASANRDRRRSARRDRAARCAARWPQQSH